VELAGQLALLSQNDQTPHLGGALIGFVAVEKIRLIGLPVIEKKSARIRLLVRVAKASTLIFRTLVFG
jgi:hypothetical protein